MWFKNKRDEGVVYDDLFNPFPVHAIALILTAVKSFTDLIDISTYVLQNRLNAISTSGYQGPKLM